MAQRWQQWKSASKYWTFTKCRISGSIGQMSGAGSMQDIQLCRTASNEVLTIVFRNIRKVYKCWIYSCCIFMSAECFYTVSQKNRPSSHDS